MVAFDLVCLDLTHTGDLRSSHVKRCQTRSNATIEHRWSGEASAAWLGPRGESVRSCWRWSPPCLPRRTLFRQPTAAGISAQLDRAAIVAATVADLAPGRLARRGAARGGGGAARVLGGRQRSAVVSRLAQLLLPRALRGIVVTAVGVGSLAAMTGCATGAAADGPTDDGGTGPHGRPVPTVDLDWPLDPPTVAADPVAPAPPPAPVTTGPVSNASRPRARLRTPPAPLPPRTAPRCHGRRQRCRARPPRPPRPARPTPGPSLIRPLL